jgi:hypothetical protein
MTNFIHDCTLRTLALNNLNELAIEYQQERERIR